MATNILVVDTEETSSHLIRSILKAQGFNVSISLTEEEALAKLHTGLFDMVFIDLNMIGSESFSIVKQVNNLLPGLPIILMSHTHIDLIPDDAVVFRTLDKPIKISRIINAARHALEATAKTHEKRRFWRKEVDIPVEITWENFSIPYRITNISMGGIQIESSVPELPIRFGEFFRTGRQQTVNARIELAENRSITVPARVTYVERFHKAEQEQIGLSFDELPVDAKKTLASVVYQVEDEQAAN